MKTAKEGVGKCVMFKDAFTLQFAFQCAFAGTKDWKSHSQKSSVNTPSNSSQMIFL